jgi:hypothetical protein
MMVARGNRNRSEWTSVGLVLVVGIILGVLAERSAQPILSAHWNAAGPIQDAAGSPPHAMGGPDSLYASASALGRDPFRAPAAPRPERQAALRDPAPKVTGPPVVRALLYDNVNPTVQIGVGGMTSGWLHTGDNFEGWTVVEINPTSVRVSRDGESVVLPSS